MKLWACGFEIVCEFVPGFVPNAYARTRGGFGGKVDKSTTKLDPIGMSPRQMDLKELE